MQPTEWRYTDGTGSGCTIGRSGSIGVAAAVTFAFLAGTGGVTGPSYFQRRQERGYAFVQVRPAGETFLHRLRSPEEDLVHIRAVFKPSISDIAHMFRVSRQSVYNWMAGERPSRESIEKLDDLARAADLFRAEGFTTSSPLFRRRLEGGKTLIGIVREGGSAQDAARELLQIAWKEGTQREALRSRLADRTRSARDYSDAGSPMLDEDLGL